MSKQRSVEILAQTLAAALGQGGNLKRSEIFGILLQCWPGYFDYRHRIALFMKNSGTNKISCRRWKDRLKSRIYCWGQIAIMYVYTKMHA